MQAKHLLSVSERKSALRQVIRCKVPSISPEQLDIICNTVNTKRRYFVKATSNKEKFMNLVTRETIITDESRVFSEVIPLYGSFHSPYFEKIRDKRFSEDGSLDRSRPAAAVKIRIGTENKRTSATYSLIFYTV